MSSAAAITCSAARCRRSTAWIPSTCTSPSCSAGWRRRRDPRGGDRHQRDHDRRGHGPLHRRCAARAGPEVAVTRLASGLPVGSDLEYADEITLGRALRGRQALDLGPRAPASRPWAPWPARGPRRLPARLSRHLRDAGDGGRGRPRDARRRRPRPPDHRRLPVRQGVELPRPRVRRRPRAPSAGARRAEGRGPFRRASWDEALDRVAERLRRARDEHGGEAILPYSYMGTMGCSRANIDERRA